MTEEIDINIEETIAYVAQSIRAALGVTVPKDFTIPVGPTCTCEGGVVTFTYPAYYQVTRFFGEYSIDKEDSHAGQIYNEYTDSWTFL